MLDSTRIETSRSRAILRRDPPSACIEAGGGSSVFPPHRHASDVMMRPPTVGTGTVVRPTPGDAGAARIHSSDDMLAAAWKDTQSVRNGRGPDAGYTGDGHRLDARKPFFMWTPSRYSSPARQLQPSAWRLVFKPKAKNPRLANWDRVAPSEAEIRGTPSTDMGRRRTASDATGSVSPIGLVIARPRSVNAVRRGVSAVLDPPAGTSTSRGGRDE